MVEILNILNKLSDTGSTNEKIKILKSVTGDNLIKLKYILNAAYDPYKVFHIGSASLKKLRKNKKIGCGKEERLDKFVVFLAKMVRKPGCLDADFSDLINILSEMKHDVANMCILILKKNLGIKMGAKTINKAFKDLIPVFDIQLCEPITEIPKGDFLVSPKLDGLRCLAIPGNNGYSLFSRNGHVLDFPELVVNLNTYCLKTNLIFDGELLGSDWNDSMKVTRKYNRNTKDLKYNLIDCVFSNEWFGNKSPAESSSSRYDRLLNIFSSFTFDKIKVIPNIVMDNKDDILTFYSYCLDCGFEGIVLKDVASVYDKKRTWLKKKPSDTYDLTVVACLEGTGKNEGVLGAFAVDFNGVIVNVSGMKDWQRKEFWENKENMVGMVIEVESDAVTKDGSLRFPRFKSLRKDKA